MEEPRKQDRPGPQTNPLASGNEVHANCPGPAALGGGHPQAQQPQPGGAGAPGSGAGEGAPWPAGDAFRITTGGTTGEGPSVSD
jgi:hypothetical protein